MRVNHKQEPTVVLCKHCRFPMRPVHLADFIGEQFSLLCPECGLLALYGINDVWQGPRLVSDQSERWENRVDPFVKGGFIAFWHGRPVFENGRIKTFDTQDEAWQYLIRCDAAERITYRGK